MNAKEEAMKQIPEGWPFQDFDKQILESEKRADLRYRRNQREKWRHEWALAAFDLMPFTAFAPLGTEPALIRPDGRLDWEFASKVIGACFDLAAVASTRHKAIAGAIATRAAMDDAFVQCATEPAASPAPHYAIRSQQLPTGGDVVPDLVSGYEKRIHALRRQTRDAVLAKTLCLLEQARDASQAGQDGYMELAERAFATLGELVDDDGEFIPEPAD